MASNSGDSGKPRLSGLPLLAAALGVVLAVQALFVLSYVGALHHPKPHDVAFGVVGNSRLPIAVGKQFSLKVRQYPDEAAARSAIDHRRIDGAFVADSGGGTCSSSLRRATPAQRHSARRSGRRRPRWNRS